MDLPLIIIRKETKEYGTKGQIVGILLKIAGFSW